jgi:hypothetical protein
MLGIIDALRCNDYLFNEIYLGIPLPDNKLTRIDFSPLFTKPWNYLVGYKAHLLSWSGTTS